MLASDAPVVEGGYTRTELRAIAEAAGVEEFSTEALEMLEEAFDAYCWACSADPGGFLFYSDEQKRCRLKQILKVIVEHAPTAEIEQRCMIWTVLHLSCSAKPAQVTRGS
jgi:hypothetical protein